MRLDLFLTENGFFKSRSKAQAAINSGNVTVNGKKAEKASLEINGDEDIRVINTERFVSRAGEKLFHAINEFGIDVKGPRLTSAHRRADLPTVCFKTAQKRSIPSTSARRS